MKKMKKNAKKNLKKWRRKSLALLLVLSMTVTLFSGCSFRKEGNKTADKNSVSQGQTVPAKEDVTENISEESASTNNVLNGYAESLSKLTELTEIINSHAEAGQTEQALRVTGQLKQALSESEKAAGILAEQTTEIQKKLDDTTQKIVQDRQNQFNQEQKTFWKKLTHTLDDLQQASGKKQICKHARKLETLFQQELQDYGDNLPPEQAEAGEITTQELSEEKQQENPAAGSASQHPTDETEKHQTSSEYLECTGATALTPAIREKAEELKTPLAVYEYLRNNLDYEYYGGSRKGAGQTLAAMAGNDYDQASLLTAMLRHLGYETRYVKGKIRLDAGMAVRMTGAETAELAAKVFAVSGNNVTILTKEEQAEYLQMEHVWVEAYVPYTDYRGAGRAEGKSMWIPLDTGIKEYEDQETLYDKIDQSDAGKQLDTLIKEKRYDDFYSFADQIVDQEEQEFSNELEKLNTAQSQEDQPEFSYHLRKRGIRQENVGYLPNSLPYLVTGSQRPVSSYAEADRDQVVLALAGQKMISWYHDEIAGKRISLEYVPATTEDSQILKEYGSIFQVPSYLLKLMPVIRLDGDIVKTGIDISEDLIVSPGENLSFDLTIQSGGTKKTVTNDLTAGSMYAVLLDSQNIPADGLKEAYDSYTAQADTVNTDNVLTNDYLGRMLYLAGKFYFAQVDITNAMAAQIMDICNTRTLSEGISGYRVMPVSVGDSTVAVQEGSLYIDVDYNAHTPVSLTGSQSDERRYMLTSGILASRLESYVWEEITGDEAVSTISILSSAKEQGTEILQLTNRNFEQETSNLSWDNNLKQDIRDAVNQGSLVIIPESASTIGEWQGTGYMVLNPETYAGAYIIHGGLVGNASGGAGAVRATLAYLVRGFSDAMALLSAVNAVVAVCDLLAASLAVVSLATVVGVVVLGAFVIAGVLALGDCFQVTEQYVEYMNTGNEELLKQMEAETAKAVALDAVFFVAGKAVKYLANKYQLKIWEKWSAEILLNPDLLDELASSGVKYNPDDVIMVTKNVEGKLMWLEKGNSKAGLEHILAGHEDHFAKKGIKDIPAFLQYILSLDPLGDIDINERGFFARYIYDNSKYGVAYGTNGFIVSFYPLR